MPTDAVVLAKLAKQFDVRGKLIARTLYKMWSKQTVKIDVLGDSILATTTVGNAAGGIPGTNDCMSLVKTDLQTRFGCTIALNNRATGGTTTYVETVGQWANTLAAQPDLLIIGGGKNDIDQLAQAGNLKLQGQSVASAAGLLERQIAEIRQVLPNTDLILFIDNPYSSASTSNQYSRQWNAAARRVAAAYDVLVVDGYTWFANLSGGWDSLLYDGTHPNVAGNRALADAFLANFPAEWTPEMAQRQGASFLPHGVAGSDRVNAPWTHSRLGLVTLNSIFAPTARARFQKSGSWTGSGPWTTSTAGDDFVATVPASDALIHLTLGAGQGIVDIHVDGSPTWTNVDLSTMANGKYLHITDMGQGWHFVRVKVVSGSVTMQEVRYEHQRAAWLDYTTLTASGMGTPSAGLNSFPGGGGALSAAAGTLTRTFVGTAVDMALWRSAAGGTAYITSVTIDGVTVANPTLNSSWLGYTVARLASGLAFGKHTVVITFAAGGLYVGGFVPIDERVATRPARVEGWANASEVVYFPQDFPYVPFMSSKDPSVSLSFSSVTASGFTMGATAGWWVAQAADESAGNRLLY